MNIEIRERMKEGILGFIKQQPGYDSDDVAEITITRDGDMYVILYGESFETGIAGVGSSPSEAFNDFITTWINFKGFEWINKSKILSGIN